MPARKRLWDTFNTWMTVTSRLSSGPVVGFSVNPKTVQNIMKGMDKTHSDNVSKQLEQVLTTSKYIILNVHVTLLLGPSCHVLVQHQC